MGRHKLPKKSKVVTVALSLPPDTAAQVRKAAKTAGCTVSAIARIAFGLYLDKQTITE